MNYCNWIASKSLNSPDLFTLQFALKSHPVVNGIRTAFYLKKRAVKRYGACDAALIQARIKEETIN